MKIFAIFFVAVAIFVRAKTLPIAEPIFSKQFGSEAVQISSYIGPSHYPGYYLYNYLQIDQGKRIPITVFDDGRPGITQLQPIYNYYGTPVYDYRYHYNQPFPGFSGFPGGQRPSLIPAQTPIFPPTQTTEKPFVIDVDDDGIEKLDEKVDPNLDNFENQSDSNKKNDDDDDTVTIEAL